MKKLKFHSAVRGSIECADQGRGKHFSACGLMIRTIFVHHNGACDFA